MKILERLHHHLPKFDRSVFLILKPISAEKKTPFLVQLKQIFVPSYFVRALEQVFHFIKKILSKQVNAGSDISPSTKIRKKVKFNFLIESSFKNARKRLIQVKRKRF